MDVSHILNNLNDAQRDAVTAPLGNMLVLAGAGSGKTRVLVHRIAWLIAAEGLSAHQVMAVTFTNKAAREMRGRLEELLGYANRNMWVGTFHGLAHRLLKMHWREAKLNENFQILDADDQLRLVKRIAKQLDLDESHWPARQIVGFINAQKDEGRRAAHIDPGQGDLYQRTMLRAYTAYEEACERSGIVDFAELLLRAHELWLYHPELLQLYRQRFGHILVDEFQDTNTIQYAWLRVLAGDVVSITAVGDDDQSIYGWRGAKIENIQQFSRDFSEPRMVRLEQNYRSTANILNAANAVISHNSDRLGKELWTEGLEGEKIDFYAGFNEQDEARFVVDEIQKHVNNGMARTELAILYRSNAQSRVIEEALIRAGVPYRIYGGQRFYDRLEIKNALAYMRLLNNRHDDAAIERVINTPVRGIGAKTVETMREYARDHGCSMWHAGSSLIVNKHLPNRAASCLEDFYNLIEKLDNDTTDLDLADIADHVITVSGLIEHHKKEKGEKGQARVENLEELVSACKVFEPAEDSEEERSLLAEFLDTAALDAGEAQADEFEDSVQLMTLHSAKGLEFHTVFMVGVEEGLFPHKMSISEPGRLEEERRLCYVGITRAMHKLYITIAESRRMHGSETYNTPSRFVKEIPVEYLNEIRMQAKVSRPMSFGRAAPSSTSFDNYAIPETGIALGQRVIHSIFGEGVVLNFEGQGKSARVQVNFDNQGSKWLVLAYANLQVI
jgi:DNA helicase-2/ATP-dependent DNA helicase PcrA